MTFKIFLEVVACNDFGLGGTLGKDDANVLAACGVPLQRKRRAWPAVAIRLVEIDAALFHNLPYFLPADVPTIHAAKCVFCVVQACRVSVECFSLPGLVPAPYDKGQENQQQKKNGKKDATFFHGGKLGCKTGTGKYAPSRPSS